MRLCPHRIGEEVEFSTSDDPNAIWSGTSWTQITDGRVTLASSSTHALGSTGGAETVTLDVTQIPSHSHPVEGPKGHTWGANFDSDKGTCVFGFSPSGVNGNFAYGQQALKAWEVGGGQAHTNMQPWRAVNRWQRVA